MNKIAYYHLPGLFEFYELYRLFLPLFFEHREYFYDWCAIGSIYGAPSGCLWGGGRLGLGNENAEEVLALLKQYGISGRLTFSNSLLEAEHLADKKCNDLCAKFEKAGGNGIIVHADLLLNYLQKKYPGLYFVSSTTKVLREFGEFEQELRRKEFLNVVIDFRLNKDFANLDNLSEELKAKVEFLCNECCDINCKQRRACYENVSRMTLDDNCPEFKCVGAGGKEGYRFSRAMESPAFIGIDDIVNIYLPGGFEHFKIEGRGLGSALILEFLLYYLCKPAYQLRVREAIYLDNMLDLF